MCIMLYVFPPMPYAHLVLIHGTKDEWVGGQSLPTRIYTRAYLINLM